ncbi:MAG: hypothetical protein WA419_04605, partial [Silvibacterium sp.]
SKRTSVNRIWKVGAALLACLSLSACHSAFVQTSIVNHTGKMVQLVEVDYPSASFGTQQIADNATYHYHFKIQGSGPVKITFTGDADKAYSATGPTLEPGQQGSLTITLESDGKVTWTPALSSP